MTSANSSLLLPVLRGQSLHALAYCERLFYLEEVERIRLADAAVYAGRRLHVELEREEEGEWQVLDLESETLGLRGRVDCLRRRDGSFIPYEHKRGRAARKEWRKNGTESSRHNEAMAWPSDRIQVAAYAMMIEETLGQTISEARVRYHQDHVTVRVPVDEAARDEVRRTIARARELGASVERPPVTSNERLCVKCSLAPACLPEEARRAMQTTQAASDQILAEEDETELDRAAIAAPLSDETEGQDGELIADCNGMRPGSAGILPARFPDALDPESGRQDACAPRDQETSSGEAAQTILPKPVVRLFPADDQRQALHVVTQGAKVGRAGDQIEVTTPDEPRQRYPVREVGQVVLHGFAQITTQALRLCADKEVGVHWLTQGGSYIGSFSSGAGSVQRRIRQYRALDDPAFCLGLTRRLAEAKIISQLRFLLRASRDRDRAGTGIADSLEGIRKLFPALKRAASVDEIRGVEGRAGALYFEALPALIDRTVDATMRPDGRSRRPPRDRCNALLGFGYALLLKDVMSAILVVGLDPALGFYHRPRSQAHPLALDLIELFRVAMVDLPLIASINRRQWNPDEDFSVTGQQVWLSATGRRKLIEVYERRKTDTWKHALLGYSLSYARLIELEVRLLEKEWTGEPGLFARMRLR